MLGRINNWLKPPIFPEDDKKNARAQVINTMGLYFTLVLVIAALFYVSYFATHKLESWGVILMLLALYGIARIFLFNGKLTFASIFLLGSSWLVCEGVAFIGGGINSPMMFALAAATMAMGLLFHSRIATMFLTLNVLTGLGFAVLQQNGVALPQHFVYSPLGVWFYFALALVFIHWTMKLTQYKLESAVALAHREEKARRQAEEDRLQNEERFQMFMKYLPGLAYIKDTDGHCLFASQGFAALLGFNPKDMFGKTDIEIFGPEFGAKISQDDQLVLKSGTAHTIEEEFGGRTWTTHKFSINQHEAAPLLGGITLDITQRKLAEKALHESEEKYKLLFESAGDVILIHDKQGRMLAVNSLAVKRFGYTRAELMTMTIDQIDTPEEGHHTSERITTLMQQGRHAFETVHQCKDGSRIPTDVTSRKVIWDDTPAMMSICRDITERKQFEETLQASEKRYSTLVETADDAIVLTDLQGRSIYRNSAYYTNLGFEVGDEVNSDGFKRVHPDDIPIVQAGMDQLFQKGEASGEYRVQHADGHWVYRYNKAKIIRDQAGKPQTILSVIRDVTERRSAEDALRESEALFSTIFQTSPVGIGISRLDGYFLEANDALCGLFGYTHAELIGNTVHTLNLWIHPEQRVKMVQLLEATGSAHNLEVQLQQKTGGIRDVLINAELIELKGEKSILAMLLDITERKLSEEALRYLSTHDPLTGIFNRTFFETELARIEHGRNFPVSIVVADLDNMKTTNDSLGHVAGDELLRSVALILRGMCRAEDIIARIGGDEFAILLPTTDEMTAGQLLSRLQARLIEHNNQHPELPVQLSLGKSTAERSNLMEAFILADQHMYADKAKRKAAQGKP